MGGLWFVFYFQLSASDKSKATAFQMQLQQMRDDRDRALKDQDEVTRELEALKHVKRKGELFQSALKKEAEFIMSDLEEAYGRLRTILQENNQNKERIERMQWDIRQKHDHIEHLDHQVSKQ